MLIGQHQREQNLKYFVCLQSLNYAGPQPPMHEIHASIRPYATNSSSPVLVTRNNVEIVVLFCPIIIKLFNFVILYDISLRGLKNVHIGSNDCLRENILSFEMFSLKEDLF